MSLSDLASIGSLVSGGAVLISLIYLSLQVRQAERNQRAAVNHGMAQRIFDSAYKLTEPPLAEFHYEAMMDAEDLSGAEVLQLMNIVTVMASGAMEAWVQRKTNLIDDRMFQLALGPVKTMLCRPVYRAVWPMARRSFPRDFGEMFEREIYAEPIRPAVDLVEQFKANLAALRAVASGGLGAA